MSVTYEDAMRTLTGMFGALDRDIIADVLRANKGHMERTVDVLLTMCGDAPLNSETLGAPVALTPTTPQSPREPRTLSGSGRYGGSSGVAATTTTAERIATSPSPSPPFSRSRSPSPPLSPSPSPSSPSTSPSATSALPSELSPAVSQAISQTQISQDEVLARMLQNQIFLQEMRRDDVLGDLLSRQAPTTNTRYPTAYPTAYPYAYPYPSYGGLFGLGDTTSISRSGDVALQDEVTLQEIKDKLNQLGETAKLKFKELAFKFGGKPAAKYSQLSTQDSSATGNSKNSLSTSAAAAAADGSKLDEDDEEVVAFDSSLARRNAARTRKFSPDDIDINIDVDDDASDDSEGLEDKRRTRRAVVTTDSKKDK